MSSASSFGAPGRLIFVVGAQLLKNLPCTSQNSASRTQKKAYEKNILNFLEGVF
jgi:hypothetical protein